MSPLGNGNLWLRASVQQRELPKEIVPLPFLRIVQGKAGGTCDRDDGDKAGQNRDVNRIKPNESVPEKDLHRTTTRRRKPCEIDMRNDEPREDEEEINAEITAGKERQKRIEAGWYILLCVHAQDQ